MNIPLTVEILGKTISPCWSVANLQRPGGICWWNNVQDNLAGIHFLLLRADWDFSEVDEFHELIATIEFLQQIINDRKEDWRIRS